MVEITRPHKKTAHLIGPALVEHCNNRRKVADELGIDIKTITTREAISTVMSRRHRAAS